MEEQKLIEIYKDMSNLAPEILVDLRKLHVEYMPFFVIWERTGKHLTEFPYNVQTFIAKIVFDSKQIIKRSLKIFYTNK